MVEAFGCDPAPEAIERFAAAARAGGPKRAWINLEYLSAEPYVERLHGLPSPVFSGPGEGLTKHFFYPGFSEATGGLLREPDLVAKQAAFDRHAWLAARGIDWQGERLVSLFCYEPPALGDLLDQLAGLPDRTRLLVTAGRATRALRAALSARGGLQEGSALSICELPYLTQPDFDHLLWTCDLNFVRGEDSMVRALWAGAPMVWQIYPQDDDAHHAKLEAFLAWLGAPPSLAEFHLRWNGFGAQALRLPRRETLDDWRATVHAARRKLHAQDDLVTRLRRFIAQKS
jgi:uncharacterized repeat protein (TIGR03837 family)